MAGHSPWANIKHKKALIDAKRGKLWSKLSKAIIVAAKAGGADTATNLKLRYAIDDAKAVSMPKENIQRAIKSGTGELAGGNLEEALYEGYGPHGVAVICEILTDNRNRTAPEIRKVFELAGGNLGATNCVNWMFELKGLLLVPQNKISEDELMEIVLEAGADDLAPEGDNFRILTPTDKLQAVKAALEAKSIPTEVAQLTRVPTNTVELDVDAARDALALMEKLDDHDDVQNAYANFTLTPAALEALANE
ncbi:MAG TPA: YebC/PmpR family DNA-binding transcriptional regulator [Pirellulales bacterium]